jgi:WS/DGAT/MGAT family acyltransferase
MANDRLSPLDTSFLHLEDEQTHMHVASVMIFDGPAPSYEEFLARVGSRLHLVPRYRQKLALVPFNQGRPRWVDDDEFDLRYHVRAGALPKPRSEYELQVLAGRVFSQQLKRDKPLWELWLVEELEGERFAVLSKTHHALVDGISGLDILSVLFSEDEAQTDKRWLPEPAPPRSALLAEAIVERLTMPAEMLRPARAMLRRPQQLLAGARDGVRGMASLLFDGAAPAPPSPYNPGTIGGDRRFTWVRCDLADLKAIKNNMGGTVNDVVLTIVSRGLRRHLERRGELSKGQTLKAFVPVSVRTEDQSGTLGNQVSGMLATLPISCNDPAVCLRRISNEMQTLKDSGQAVGAQALTELAGFAPPNIMSQASRLLSRQRFFNLVVTNVPGPQYALKFDGREMRDIFPMVPLAKNQALGVAILSYNGAMNFGLVGDFDHLHDLEELAEDFTAAVEEIAAAAKVKLGSGTTKAAPKRFVRKNAGAPDLTVVDGS